jgi:hypothetical protein
MRLQVDPLACSEVDKHAMPARRVGSQASGIPKPIIDTKACEGSQGRFVAGGCLTEES